MADAYQVIRTLLDEQGGQPLSDQAQRRRFVEAMRSKPRRAGNTKRQPTQVAPSREACPRCGIPGTKGCDHYLPLVARPLPENPPRHAGYCASRDTPRAR